MKKLIESLMLRLGVSETVAKLIIATIPDTLEAPKDITLDTVVKEASEKLLGNPEFTKPFEVRMKKRYLEFAEKKVLKALELTDEELAKLPEEKRIEAIADLIGTKLADKKGDGGDDKDAEIVKLNETIRTLKSEKKKLVEVDLPEALKAGEREREGVILDRFFEQHLPGKEGLAVDIAFALPGAKAKALDLYDWKVVGGKVVLRKKGEDVPAFDANNNEIKPESVIESIATEGKLRKVNGGRAELEEQPGGAAPKGRNREMRKQTEQREVMSPGMAKAKAREAEMAAERKKKTAEA